VLVAQDRARVAHCARQGERWVPTALDDLGAALRLPSLAATLRLANVFERVAPFAAEAPGRR
jgi:hypothetical protein